MRSCRVVVDAHSGERVRETPGSASATVSSSDSSPACTRWSKAMDDATEAVRTGAKPNENPTRREALPAPGKTTLSREVVAENVARLKAMLEPVVQAKAVNE